VVGWSKQSRNMLRVEGFDAPEWVEHFKTVLSFT